MKLFSLAALASLLASPAFANPPAHAARSAAGNNACHGINVKSVITCQPETPTRSSHSVEIKDCGGKLFAFVTMPGMTATPSELGHVEVKQSKPDAKKMGAGQTYDGKDFDLHVNWTTAPKKGGHVGHVKTKVGGEVDADLICKLSTAHAKH